MARSRTKCGQTGLTSYTSQLEAQLALAAIHKKNSMGRHRANRDEPTTTFRCPHDGHYHLRRKGFAGQ
jgi:hypothetical protein